MLPEKGAANAKPRASRRVRHPVRWQIKNVKTQNADERQSRFFSCIKGENDSQIQI